MSRVKILGEINTTIKLGFSLPDDIFIPIFEAFKRQNRLSREKYSINEPLLRSCRYDYKTNLWRLNIQTEYPILEEGIFIGVRYYDEDGKPESPFKPYHFGHLHKQIPTDVNINDIYPKCVKCKHLPKGKMLYCVNEDKEIVTVDLECRHKKPSSGALDVLWRYTDYSPYSPSLVESVKNQKPISPLNVIAIALYLQNERADENRSMRLANIHHLCLAYVNAEGEGGRKSPRWAALHKDIDEFLLPASIYLNWVLTEMPQTTEGLKMINRLASKREINRQSARIFELIPKLYRAAENGETLNTPFDSLDQNFLNLSLPQNLTLP